MATGKQQDLLERVSTLGNLLTSHLSLSDHLQDFSQSAMRVEAHSLPRCSPDPPTPSNGNLLRRIAARQGKCHACFRVVCACRFDKSKDAGANAGHSDSQVTDCSPCNDLESFKWSEQSIDSNDKGNVTASLCCSPVLAQVKSGISQAENSMSEFTVDTPDVSISQGSDSFPAAIQIKISQGQNQELERETEIRAEVYSAMSATAALKMTEAQQAATLQNSQLESQAKVLLLEQNISQMQKNLISKEEETAIAQAHAQQAELLQANAVANTILHQQQRHNMDARMLADLKCTCYLLGSMSVDMQEWEQQLMASRTCTARSRGTDISSREQGSFTCTCSLKCTRERARAHTLTHFHTHTEHRDETGQVTGLNCFDGFLKLHSTEPPER